MNTLISGRANVAIRLHGTTPLMLCPSYSSSPVPISNEMIPFELADAGDIQFLDIRSESDALTVLATAFQQDRAVLMALIVLDPDDSPEAKAIALQELELFLASPATFEFVANRLCSAPLTVDLENAADDQTPLVAKLFGEIRSLQTIVSRYWSDWQKLDEKLFVTEHDRAAFQMLMTRDNLLGQFVRSHQSRPAFDAVRLRALGLSASISKSREIWNAFLHDKIPAKTNSSRNSSEEPEKLEEQRNFFRKLPPLTERFENVITQKQKIREQIHKGDESFTRKLVRELVEFQLKNGAPEYAAMSLCDLANVARDVGNSSLRLELAQNAVGIAPQDGWSYGQLADAYLAVGYIDDAAKAFRNAGIWGQSEFASSGAARILRAQGKYDDAVLAYESVLDAFPNSWHALQGLAETYRDMWKYDLALETYDRAVRTADESRLWSGRAAVLVDMGRFSDALYEYRGIINRFPDDIVPRCAHANALIEVGQVDAAENEFTRIVEACPGSLVAWCGLAEALREKGDTNGAKRIYRSASERFPQSPIPQSGYAEVCKDIGDFAEAIKIYDIVVQRFPSDSRMWISRAHVLKRMKSTTEALAEYDKAVAKFPYDLVAQTGRAYLMKELGYATESLSAFDAIIERNPRNRRAIYAKAAVLAALGRSSEALELLPSSQPVIRTDWIASHIRAAILLREGQYPSAIKLLKSGVKNCPYSKERRLFRQTLAIANLKTGRFADALAQLDDDSAPISVVVKVHALGANKDFAALRSAYQKIDKHRCPPHIRELAEELGRVYRCESGKPRHDWNWVFQKECTAILFAA